MMIALIGFTGAGKSTLGKLLTRYYGLPCYDNDDIVEKKSRMPIRDIFSIHGEKHFRELEAESIASIIHSTHYGVLVTGGGAPLLGSTRHLLSKHALTVHVEVPFDEIVRRLETDHTRPLIQGEHRERLTQLYHEREHLYDFAHVIADGTNLSMAAAKVMAAWMSFSKDARILSV